MKLNHEDLADYFRSHVMSKTDMLYDKCPSKEDIAKCFHPKTGEKYKIKIVDHVTTCAVCAEQFEAMRQIFTAGEAMEAELTEILSTRKAKERGKPGLFPFFLSMPMRISMAVGLVVLSLSLFFIFQQKPVYRSSGTKMIEYLQPGQGALVRFPIMFTWKKISDADYYKIRLFDQELNHIFESSPLIENYFSFAEESKVNIIKGRTYFWKISAFTDNGIEINLESESLARFILE